MINQDPLAHDTRTMTHHILEAAMRRAIWIGIAQMPLAKHRSAVTRCGKDMPHRHFIRHRDTASSQGAPHSSAIGRAPRHQSRTRGRTHRIDMKVGQTSALRMQLVHVRRIQKRITVAAHIGVALIVR